jgi:hypothetical protein
MLGQDSQTSWGLLAGRKIHQPKDAAMGLGENDGALAEILVQGNQNPALFECVCENSAIAWIVFPGAHPKSVVASFF